MTQDSNQKVKLIPGQGQCSHAPRRGLEGRWDPPVSSPPGALSSQHVSLSPVMAGLQVAVLCLSRQAAPTKGSAGGLGQLPGLGRVHLVPAHGH